MKELRIDMPMYQKTLVGKIYESWEEMSWQKITHVLAVFNAPIPKSWTPKATYNWQNIQILKAINDWSDNDLQRWRMGTILSHQDIDMVTSSEIWLSDLEAVLKESMRFAFFYDGVNPDNSVEVRYFHKNLYKNPLSVIKIKEKSGVFTKWYSAYSDEEEPFRDCSLYELGRIFTLYEQYRETNEREYFSELLAVLYRPEKPRAERQNDDIDDPRQPLESSHKKLRVRIAIARDQIAESVCKTIELHLTSAMAKFGEMYPSVFGGEKSKKAKKGDFLDFVLELSDFDPLKSEELFKRPAHDMFELAERLTERAKAQVAKD
jgi:hypothetical protein